MKLHEKSIEISIQEAVEDFGFPDDLVKLDESKHKVYISYEFVTDFKLQRSTLYSVRTNPINDEEVKEWKESENKLNNINWDEARKRVLVMNSNEAYEF